MKQFVIAVLASLVGVLIALVAYDRLLVVPREAAQEREREAAAEQQHQASLKQSGVQARRLARRLDATVARSVDESMARSVADAQQSMDRLAAGQERLALAAEALARASMVRTQVAEYYMTEGRWPKNGAEAGIARSLEFAGGGVAGIDVEDDGRIAIRLNDRVAANARFRLTPEVSEATGMIHWNCELHGAPDIAAQLRACQH